MKSPARKKKIKRGILAAIGATVIGVAVGVVAIFLSKKENRAVVRKTVSKTVRKGKAQVAKVKRTVVAAKKKVVRKVGKR